jgi:hypothetical protein
MTFSFNDDNDYDEDIYGDEEVDDGSFGSQRHI